MVVQEIRGMSMVTLCRKSIKLLIEFHIPHSLHGHFVTYPETDAPFPGDVEVTGGGVNVSVSTDSCHSILGHIAEEHYRLALHGLMMFANRSNSNMVEIIEPLARCLINRGGLDEAEALMNERFAEI